MGAPPGSRRFDGDLWPAPTGDDTFEALVSSSWADPAPEPGPARGQVPGPGSSGNGGAAMARATMPTGGLPPYAEPVARQDGNGRADRQPPYADLIDNVGTPSPFRPGSHQPSGQFPVVTPAQVAQSHPAQGQAPHPGAAPGNAGPHQPKQPHPSQQSYLARQAVAPPAPPQAPQGGPVPPQRPTGGYQPPQYGAEATYEGKPIVVPKPATVPIPPEALLLPQEEAPRPTSGAPTSGAPVSGVPVSGLPISGAPVSGLPVSGVPVSGAGGRAVVSGVPVSGAGGRAAVPGTGQPASQADRPGGPGPGQAQAGAGQPGAAADPGTAYRSGQSSPWQGRPDAEPQPTEHDRLWHPAPPAPVSGNGGRSGDWATLPDWSSERPDSDSDHQDPAGRYEAAAGYPEQTGGYQQPTGYHPDQATAYPDQATGYPEPSAERYQSSAEYHEPEPMGYQPQYQPYPPQYHQSPYPDPSIQEQVARYRPAAEQRSAQPAEDVQQGYLQHGTSPVGLPVRVPSRPDVPDVPDLPGMPGADIDEPPAEAPDLDRIADYLSRSELGEPDDDWRPDGFDIPAVIDAVRGVSGVREAEVRPNPNGVHTLRLELADDADPGQVSRAVARLLKERMGLAAEPNEAPTAAPAPRRNQPAPPGTAPYPREARRRRASGAGLADPTRQADPAPTPAARPAGAGQFGAPGQPATGQFGASGAGQFGAGTLPGPAPFGAAGTGPAPFGTAPAGEDGTPGGVRLDPGTAPAPRAVIDQVKVTDEGHDAVVEVRLNFGDRSTVGVSSGPAFDGYMLRLAAFATANAVDQLLTADTGPRARCFVEHATVVSLGGGCDVAVVVVLLAGDGWVEQLTGSALIVGDPRYAVVRATLAAVNRRLEALLW